MRPPAPVNRLATAHAELKRACDLLVEASPQALESCQAALESAVSQLGEFQRQRVASSPEHSTARRVHAEVVRASRLLDNLSGYFRGWERVLGAMSAGYTAAGDPAPVARQGRLSCRG